MAEDNLRFGVPVEDAVCDHAERVQADSDGEGERRADQPLSVFPELFEYDARRVARVQV